MDHNLCDYLIKSIMKRSIVAADAFLVLGYLKVLTTDNLKLKCPIKRAGKEIADSSQQAQHLDCTWQGPSWGSTCFSSIPLIETSEGFSCGRGVMYSVRLQSRKGAVASGARCSAGCPILLPSRLSQ